MLGVSANPRADAPHTAHPFLAFRDRDDNERIFVFEPGLQVASVGRRSTSDVVLDWDDQVSRLHARFERDHDGWKLVDDGLSSNGTFVNGERLNGSRRLHDGDILRFGTTAVTFRSPPPRQPAEPAAAEAPPVARTAPPVTLSSTQRRVLISLSRPCKEGNAFATPATDEQIADELVLSVAEVRAHLQVLLAKLGLGEPRGGDARARLVEQAFSHGLISERDF